MCPKQLWISSPDVCPWSWQQNRSESTASIQEWSSLSSRREEAWMMRDTPSSWNTPKPRTLWEDLEMFQKWRRRLHFLLQMMQLLVLESLYLWMGEDMLCVRDKNEIVIKWIKILIKDSVYYLFLRWNHFGWFACIKCKPGPAVCSEVVHYTWLFQIGLVAVEIYKPICSIIQLPLSITGLGRGKIFGEIQAKIFGENGGYHRDNDGPGEAEAGPEGDSE